MRGLLLLALVALGAGFAWHRMQGLGEASNDPLATPEREARELPSGRRRVVGEPIPAPAAGDALDQAIAANNRAVALLESGDLDGAVDELEPAFAAAPEHAVVRANLVEALARRALAEHDRAAGDRAAALADLERAVELARDREDLGALLGRWRTESEVEAEFTAYTSMHFELAFDGDRTALLHGAQEAIDVLEDAYADFRLFLDHDPVREQGSRLRVTLYAPEEFRQLTGLGHWAGGAYDGTVRVPVDDFVRDRGRWSRTLRHELLHAFLGGYVTADLPGWLNEGLAQWHEVRGADLERDLRGANGALEDGNLLTLAELSGPLSRLEGEDRIGLAYAQSLVFTDYVIARYGELGMARLLASMAEGASVDAAFRGETGVSLSSVFEDFRLAR